MKKISLGCNKSGTLLDSSHRVGKGGKRRQWTLFALRGCPVTLAVKMWMISLNFKEVGKTIPDDSSQMITGKGNEKGCIRCISIVHLVCVNFELKLMSKDPTLSDKCEKAGQVFVEFPTLERGGDVQLPKESYAHTNEETSHRIFLKCRSEGNIAWRK